MSDIFPVKDSAGNHYRNLLPVFLFILSFTGYDLPDLIIVIQFIHMLQLFSGKSQMSACFRSFYHDKVRGSVVFVRPHLKDQLRRAAGGNNGRDLRPACFTDQRRKVHRQTGAADDHIRSGRYRFFHMLRVMFQSDHNVHADQAFPAGDLLRPLYMFPDRPRVASRLILRESLLIIADLCRGDHADAAFFRHCSGKAAAADPYAHTSLNDGNIRNLLPYTQFLKFCSVVIHIHNFPPAVPVLYKALICFSNNLNIKLF